MAYNEIQSDEESFNNCFYYFIDALNILSLNPEEQCKNIGGDHVPWEILHDVLDNGTTLVNWHGSYLSSEEKCAINQLLSVLMTMPDIAVASNGIKTMNHFAWDEPRKCAKLLIEVLKGATLKNTNFFKRHN